MTRTKNEEIDWEESFPGSIEAYEEIKIDPVINTYIRFSAALKTPGIDFTTAAMASGIFNLEPEQITEVLAMYRNASELAKENQKKAETYR